MLEDFEKLLKSFLENFPENSPENLKHFAKNLPLSAESCVIELSLDDSWRTLERQIFFVEC